MYHRRPAFELSWKVASAARKLPDNVPGDFFVDSTCIDCGACRWIAPESFDYRGGYSRVYRQPAARPHEQAALRALVACPTGSIGAQGDHDVSAAIDSFPYPLAEQVLHCGFHSEDSFGAARYPALRPEGNVLVDSPRWNRRLAARIDALGGARYLFLTHRDDVADHARWAEHLRAERIIRDPRPPRTWPSRPAWPRCATRSYCGDGNSPSWAAMVMPSTNDQVRWIVPSAPTW